MLDELRPLGLKDAAIALGVDPFEVVRLCVVNDLMPERWEFDEERIEQLREAAGVEDWWEEQPLPSDPDPRRARVRGALKQLVDKEIVGSTTTRVDNVWRGLADDERMLLEKAVTILVHDGHLATSANAQGLQISVNPGSVPVLEKFANGGDAPRSLSPLWMG